MPAQANTKKAFNPTITALFEDARFGEGALVSAKIDAKAYAVIQQSVQIGSKLLLRVSPKKNKNGGQTNFLEVLAPLPETSKPYSGRKATTNRDDGI